MSVTVSLPYPLLIFSSLSVKLNLGILFYLVEELLRNTLRLVAVTTIIILFPVVDLVSSSSIGLDC